MSGEQILRIQTIEIICLGLIALAAGTAGGVLWTDHENCFGQQDQSAHRFCRRIRRTDGSACIPSRRIERQPVQPLADAGHVARNVAGVIGTAVAAGTMLAQFGG